MTATTKRRDDRPHGRGRGLRPRARPLPARPARGDIPPEPAWRVGHYDGPTDSDGRHREARFLATGIVPPIYRRNPGACLTLLLKAQALDIPIATALETIYWNEAVGKGAMLAQLMAALLRRHNYEYKVTVETGERVEMVFYRIVDGRRRKLGEPVVWKMIEAVGAGISWRDQWRHYPTDMLWARCLMRGARRYASEVGTGLAYTPEELGDMAGPIEGGEVADAVQEILEKATSVSATAAIIRDVLVKEAAKKKLLDADTGDGQTLGYVLGMLWGEKRAVEVDQVNAATALAAVDAPADPGAAPVGEGVLSCGCPGETLRTGTHQPGVCRD